MYETDYLIIGAGAIGMNCSDVLLDETKDDILMIDRRAAPGGHWRDAYSFVRLHQPSVYYGVPSRDLGTNLIDTAGSNMGYYDLPSGAEVSAYFEAVMRERFVPSGRVRFLPMHDFDQENATVTALLSGATQPIKVRKRIIDTTFFGTAVPSLHTPAFAVDRDVHFVTPNALPGRAEGHGKFTVVGGGKTGMDVCVWLLENGATADQIRWIVPRDSWLINRAMTQPGDDFFYATTGGYASMLEAAANGQDVDDVFARLEESECMLRIDPNVQPTMFRNATMSTGEIDVLRQITDVVRLGHVRRISPTVIELDAGRVDAQPDHLYIDCTAKAFTARASEPVFTSDRILPQLVMNGGVCLSAALIAYVEANFKDDAIKNDICTPVPLMDKGADWLAMIYWHLRNVKRRSTEKDLGRWMYANRLSGFGGPKGTREAPDPDYLEIMQRIKVAAPLAGANLKRLMAGA